LTHIADMVASNFTSSKWQKVVGNVFICPICHHCTLQPWWLLWGFWNLLLLIHGPKRSGLVHGFNFWKHMHVLISMMHCPNVVMISSHVTNKNLEVWIVVIVFNKTCLYICFAMIHFTKSLQWQLGIFGTLKKLKDF